MENKKIGKSSLLNNNNPRVFLLKELRIQADWEWKHERRARLFQDWMEYLDIFAQIITVAIATVLLTGKILRELDPWLLGVVALAGTVGLALNRLNGMHRYQQRQQVHDKTARAYETIRHKLEMNSITVEEAEKQFHAIYKQPTEVIIRSTT